jgi:hypothetical protein
MTELKRTVRDVGRREPNEEDARIQEICDQLHRLEALVSVTVPVPMAPTCNASAASRSFVFFREPFEQWPQQQRG